jgi:hypothetical protein
MWRKTWQADFTRWSDWQADKACGESAVGLAISLFSMCQIEQHCKLLLWMDPAILDL